MYTLFIMILRYPLLQNIFTTKISKVLLLFFCFRLDRPTGPVDRRLHQDVHDCARLLTDRPGRPTVCSLLSGFLGRPPGSTARRTLCFSLRTVDPGVDRSPTALCQQSWRPTGPVDRQACKSPTTLSSFVQF